MLKTQAKQLQTGLTSNLITFITQKVPDVGQQAKVLLQQDIQQMQAKYQ